MLKLSSHQIKNRKEYYNDSEKTNRCKRIYRECQQEKQKTQRQGHSIRLRQ